MQLQDHTCAFESFPSQTLPGACALGMLAVFKGCANLFRPLESSPTIASLISAASQWLESFPVLTDSFPAPTKHSPPVLAASLLRSVAGDRGGRFKLDCLRARKLGVGVKQQQWVCMDVRRQVCLSTSERVSIRFHCCYETACAPKLWDIKNNMIILPSQTSLTE